MVASAALGASSAERISQPITTSPTALTIADVFGFTGAASLAGGEWSGVACRCQAAAAVRLSPPRRGRKQIPGLGKAKSLEFAREGVGWRGTTPSLAISGT